MVFRFFDFLIFDVIFVLGIGYVTYININVGIRFVIGRKYDREFEIVVRGDSVDFCREVDFGDSVEKWILGFWFFCLRVKLTRRDGNLSLAGQF